MWFPDGMCHILATIYNNIPKKMKKAVLSVDPNPLRPCCVRLEMTNTFPRLLSATISYTPSSYTTGVFLSSGKSKQIFFTTFIARLSCSGIKIIHDRLTSASPFWMCGIVVPSVVAFPLVACLIARLDRCGEVQTIHDVHPTGQIQISPNKPAQCVHRAQFPGVAL